MTDLEIKFRRIYAEHALVNFNVNIDTKYLTKISNNIFKTRTNQFWKLWIIKKLWTNFNY